MPEPQIRMRNLHHGVNILLAICYTLTVVIGVLIIPKSPAAAIFLIPSGMITAWSVLFKRWRAEMLAVWPLAFGLFLYGAVLIQSLSELLGFAILVLGTIMRGLRLIDFSYTLEGTK